MKLSFRTKLGFSVGLLSVLLTSSSLYYFYRTIYETVWHQMQDRLMDVGKTGALLITPELKESIIRLDRQSNKLSIIKDPETLQIQPGFTKESLTEEDAAQLENSKDFQELVQALRRIKASTRKRMYNTSFLEQNMQRGDDPPLLRYTYILVPIKEISNRTILKFIADADYLTVDNNGDGEISEDEEGNHIGALYNVADFPAMQTALDGNSAADPEYTQDQWGTLVSAYVPLMDQNGHVIALLGLDMRADSQYNMLNRMLLYYYGIVITSFFLSLFIAYALSRFLTGPLDRLRLGAERVRNRDFNTSIKVNSKDEIGILADTFNAMVAEIKDYSENLERQKNAFFRFVPTQFLQILGKKSAEEISPGDSTLSSMTVLFSDIRSFTTISEGMTPEENFVFLNDYLNRMEPAIQQNGGFVDKYVGDAIMALFSEDEHSNNVSRTLLSSADRAVQSAIDMRRELIQFNKQASLPQVIEMGVGITTGALMLGTVGSRTRIDTTVIGNTVNLAARLESITRAYRTPIVISADTLNALENPSSFHIRQLDTIIVKGQTKAVDIYEVFDADDDEVIQLKLKTQPILQEAIARYRASGFREAEELFLQAYRIYPEDRLPHIYVKRCRDYAITPPPPDWDGAVRLRNK